RERSRRRTGSLRAAKARASGSASASVSGAARIDGQHSPAGDAFARVVVSAATGRLPLTTIDIFAIIDQSTDINLTGVGPMSRVQLALNVSDLDAAVEFYSKLFGPCRRRSGLDTRTLRLRSRR